MVMQELLFDVWLLVVSFYFGLLFDDVIVWLKVVGIVLFLIVINFVEVQVVVVVGIDVIVVQGVEVGGYWGMFDLVVFDVEFGMLVFVCLFVSWIDLLIIVVGGIMDGVGIVFVFLFGVVVV